MDINSFKILDKEACPCGSEKTYKMCCKNRKDENVKVDELMKNEGRMNHEILKLLQKSKIRTCMHPKLEECKQGIIGAHTLQKNGVLSFLAEKDHVIEFKPEIKPGGIYSNIKLESKNKATTFTGFCKYHDDLVFKPIETSKYDPSSSQQNFLYAYRIYAYEFYKKVVGFKAFQKAIGKKPSVLRNEMMVGFYRNYQLAMKDYESYREIMNNALIAGDFTKISTYVIEFDYRIAFSTCFAYAPLFDFHGNQISLNHLASLNQDRLKLNFVTVIPQDKKSYIIYSWLQEDDDYFKNYINQLKQFNINNIRRIFNNLIPSYSENIILAPKLWERFSDYQKNHLTQKLTSEFHDFSQNPLFVTDIIKSKSNFDERAPYNLFKKFS